MSAEGSTLKKGARIVLIVDLPGVAAGTPGKVGRSIGVKSTRYRVKFENGVEALSVAEGKLVSPAAWEYIKDNQMASHNEQPGPSVAAAVPISAASAPSTAPTQPPAVSPQPAPAAKPEPAAPPPPQPSTGSPQAKTSSGADDPRLAEFFAKSRAAKKALGIDVDAEPVATPQCPPRTLRWSRSRLLNQRRLAMTAHQSQPQPRNLRPLPVQSHQLARQRSKHP